MENLPFKWEVAEWLYLHHGRDAWDGGDMWYNPSISAITQFLEGIVDRFCSSVWPVPARHGADGANPFLGTSGSTR